MAWAPTPQQIADDLNITVDDATVAIAQTIIEDELGRTEEAASGNITAGSRNERIIRRAIAYQAIYLDANPGLLTSLDLESFSQPDYSATLRAGTAGSHILSPMAKRTLRHLRGAGPRSILTESWTTDPDRAGDSDDDVTDREWSPIT